MDPDKLARITALKPAAAGGKPHQLPAGPESPQAGQLAQILGADYRSTIHGSHLSVRQDFPDPRPVVCGRQALKLLASKSPDAEDPKNWLFLDTETTGLAGGTGTYAFLVGIAWWEDQAFRVEQLFMRDHSEERSLLFDVRQAIEQRPVLVTFNGKSFDWPLLETRFRMARFDAGDMLKDHIDLLHPARQLWRHRLRSVALGELERHVLGMDRGYDIASDTIPQRYFHFLRGGPAEPLAEVFHHNKMDLRGLALLAERMVRLLEEPEQENGASELFGISRLFQRRGEIQLAGLCYERALAEGLTEAPGRTAKRELAFMAKQRGEFSQAAGLWEELRGPTADGLAACVELAKHYEHRMKDCARAAHVTREAMAGLREARNSGRLTAAQYAQRHAELQHRLDRLMARTGLQALPGTES
jgi:uncharacterized protein